MDGGVTMTLVPTDEVGRVWPLVKSLLQPAVDRTGGRWSLDDVRRYLMDGRSLLWVIFDDDIRAAFVTRVIEYPSMRCLSVDFIGGRSRHLWMGLMREKMLKFAKETGAQKLECWGRPGWSGDSRRYGYNEASRLFERDLTMDA